MRELQIKIYLLLLVVFEKNVLARFGFDDIRPKAYELQKELNIYVGNLYSKHSMLQTSFDVLPYCKHPNFDESKLDINYDDFNGFTMYDINVQESFFLVSNSFIYIKTIGVCLNSIESAKTK